MKRILLSVLTISLVTIVAVSATRAYLSDTETSVGNTFTVGTLDLNVDGGNTSVAKISVADMKPCDGVGGAEHSTIKYQWVLSNAGSLSGQPWIEIANLVNYEYGRNEPEKAVDGTGGNPGPGNGELGQHLLLQINAAGGGGFEYPHGLGCVGGRNCPLNYWADHGPVGQGTWEVITPNSSIAPMVFEFSLPCAVGNEIQSDGVEFDVVFHLDQVD